MHLVIKDLFILGLFTRVESSVVACTLKQLVSKTCNINGSETVVIKKLSICMVEELPALLPYSKEALGANLVKGCFCLFASSHCVCVTVRLIAYTKMHLGMSVSGCVSMCWIGDLSRV
ncbi:hypothetical protein ILYODFUR_008615 [Ilyodon furcidens]|uniref:Secreted protein n=1 Tax=Ilyodon furcidens TaxID=33524 RepID=A0ABV0UEF2_9TELE